MTKKRLEVPKMRGVEDLLTMDVEASAATTVSIHKIRVAKKQPRRWFDLVYNLAGNTQITKKVRLMTKTVNPKNLAIWTLGLLYLYLCEWAYSEYDTTEHPTLGMSPSDAFNQGIAKYGLRTHRLIPWDENLRILTLPTTQSQKVKVHPVQGIQIRGIHYWNSAFRDPSIHKTYVAIRYDPFDVGIAYAYIHGQWDKVDCFRHQ